MGKLELKLTEEQKRFLTPALLSYGTDLLNDDGFDRNSLIAMLLVSQRNNAVLVQRMLEDKKKHGIKLSEETLQKLQEFMNKNRFSPLLGYGWKTEEEVIDFFVDVGLKFGYSFLEKILSDSNFKSVTFTSSSELNSEEARKNAIGKLDEKEDDLHGES